MRKLTFLIVTAFMLAVSGCGPEQDTEREWDPDRGVDLKKGEDGNTPDGSSQEGEVRPERDTILNEDDMKQSPQ